VAQPVVSNLEAVAYELVDIWGVATVTS